MIEFIQTIFKFRGILFYRTIASIRADSRGLYLGYVWWLLEPALNTALYFLVFGVLLRSKTPDFIGYLLIGTTVYQFYSSSIQSSIGTITARAHLFKQIHLPKYLFAMVGVFSNFWKFVCVFSIILVFVALNTGVPIGWHLIWLPFILLIQLLVIFGFAILLSILAAYLPDLQNFTTVIFRALMFLSGIFWDVARVPEDLRWLFYANPAASLINAFRSVILYGATPNLFHLLYLMCLGLLLVNLGMRFHRKIDGHVLKHIQA